MLGKPRASYADEHSEIRRRLKVAIVFYYFGPLEVVVDKLPRFGMLQSSFGVDWFHRASPQAFAAWPRNSSAKSSRN
jgi:hypothetical protein